MTKRMKALVSSLPGPGRTVHIDFAPFEDLATAIAAS
jgi:hypothetical protein